MGNGKIFLVEDDLTEALNFKMILNRCGYDVVGTATKAEDAIKKITDLVPDLVLMDISLEGDGINTGAYIIKKLDIPVIYLINNPNQSTLKKSKFTSPYGYILKTVKKTELKNTLELALYKHQIENRLRVVEAKYRELVDNSMVAIYETNFEGELLFANDAMVKMFGYESVEDIKAVNVVQVYKNAADRERLLEKLKKEKTVTQFEVEGVTKTGNTLYGFVNAHLVGKTIMGMVIDITELKRAEGALHKSEERFRAVAESAVDAIVTTDVNGTVLFCNESLGTIFGYSRKEIIGEKLTLLMPDRNKKDYLHELKRFKRSGEHVRIGKILKTTGLKKDGTEFPFEMSLASWESLGKHYFTAIIRDITESIKTERALRDSEERYRTLFESDPDYTILITLDGVLIDINPAAEQIIGLSKKELVGKNLLELDILPKENLILNKNKFEKLMKKGNALSYETKIIDKNGEIHWVHVTSTIIKKGRECSYILLIGSDITERKLAEDGLKSSLKEKDLLIKEIHHRVKNNLQIISSLLDLQKIYVNKDSAALNVLKGSQNRVISMALVHEMLYQSQDLNRINISNYINNLISNLSYSYEVENFMMPVLSIKDIYLNIETSIPLGLLISELVSNSMKYAFPGEKTGEITITLKWRNNYFQLVISDNGIGLPEDIDFRSVKSSLGLRLVNSLVNQLDGTIELDEDHPGTRYTIEFNELKYEKRV